MEAPKAYAQQDPPKAMNVITMDCRGLEFVDFKADARILRLPVRTVSVAC